MSSLNQRSSRTAAVLLAVDVAVAVAVAEAGAVPVAASAAAHEEVGGRGRSISKKTFHAYQSRD